jgi:glucosyl-3-phosphoglycerate synthase
MQANNTYREPMQENVDYRSLTAMMNNWLVTNTYHFNQFRNIRNLIDLKEGQKISLVIPTLNEEDNIEKTILCAKNLMSDKYPLLDEINVVDSGSTDNTEYIAKTAGANFYLAEKEMKEEGGIFKGKGINLWTGLYVSKGDIIVYADADITNIKQYFFYGLLGPLLKNKEIGYTKGFYKRSSQQGKKLNVEEDGGRVTEIMARTIISKFFPLLSGFEQPLSGEYAGTREVLEQISFYSGYAVEMGLLIDICTKFGLESMAQVNLVKKEQEGQLTRALGKMSASILEATLSKAEEHGKLEQNLRTDRLLRPVEDGDRNRLDSIFIQNKKLPPMIELPKYKKRFSIK